MNTMGVEVVDIRKIVGDGALKAFADVKLGDEIIVKGFSVMQGKNGVFVAMPKKAGRDGRWFEILIPTREEIRRHIQDKVLEAYDRETDSVTG
jgi:stage V sporulation protein G